MSDWHYSESTFKRNTSNTVARNHRNKDVYFLFLRCSPSPPWPYTPGPQELCPLTARPSPTLRDTHKHEHYLCGNQKSWLAVKINSALPSGSSMKANLWKQKYFGTVDWYCRMPKDREIHCSLRGKGEIHPTPFRDPKAGPCPPWLATLLAVCPICILSSSHRPLSLACAAFLGGRRVFRCCFVAVLSSLGII